MTEVSKSVLIRRRRELYGPITGKDTYARIQADLDNILKWCSEWRLKLNTQKCFFLHYKPQNCRNSYYPRYYIGEDELERRQTAEDLGVIVSLMT